MLTSASEEYIPRWQHLICDLRRGRSKVNRCPAKEPDLTCTALDVIARFSGCLQIRTVQQTWAFATADILLTDVHQSEKNSSQSVLEEVAGRLQPWYFWVLILPGVCQHIPALKIWYKSDKNVWKTEQDWSWAFELIACLLLWFCREIKMNLNALQWFFLLLLQNCHKLYNGY